MKKSITKSGSVTGEGQCLRSIVRVTLFAAVVLLGTALAPDSLSGSASAAGSGPEMTLDVTTGGLCNGTACYAELGSNFTLTVAIEDPPVGYVVAQVVVDYGNLVPTASEDGAGPNSCSDGLANGDFDGADRLDAECATFDLIYNAAPYADEIVWPDLSMAFGEALGPAFLYRGGLTGLVPPLPVSNWAGDFVELNMTCSATPTQTTISLLPYGDVFARTSGAAFREPDFGLVVPKLASITLDCVGDTDGDGCSDVREMGADPALGGDRDRLNPWDFYDVAISGGVPGTDGVIDLTNDYMGVSAHYSPSGAPPYDVHYDRGLWQGNSWNDTAGPDGVIDLSNDIMGVIGQYGHNCT